MISSAPRLLYLGFAFPPGVEQLYPHLNPAGHALETQMVEQLRKYFDLRSTGVLPLVPPCVGAPDPGSGVDHDLLLLEAQPELYHRWVSLRRLKQQYRRWLAEGWVPDVVLAYNLSPIYNQFVLWLRRLKQRPRMALLLLDSSQLGRRLPWLKRFRRRFKPMYVPDAEMLKRFDACIGLSKNTSRYFAGRQIPFLWVPGGCTPARAIRQWVPGRVGPLRFGYYGSLGAHSGVKQMAEVFLRNHRDTTLEICGYGKGGEELAELARRDPRLRFHGFISAAELLPFGQQCDVLVNPRPATHGNENNFASKLFEYALSGQAILTSRLSGVEDVLGPEAHYFDPYDFQCSLARQLERLAGTPRAELQRRGVLIQKKVIQEFSWEIQARRLAAFLESLCGAGSAVMSEPAEALAA